MHTNASNTWHIHHAGRAEYTLLYPGKDGAPPRVEVVVMGTDQAKGEVKQVGLRAVGPLVNDG